MRFCQEQLARVRPLWEKMLGHQFLIGTRDGKVPFETFATWMRQDYLFVEAAIPFVAALIPKAPEAHWEFLSGMIAAFRKELALFEERAAVVGVHLRGAPPAFANHAYIQFLMATAYRASYAEAFTVFYAAEKAYHDSWSVVKAGIDPGSPWVPFVENWAGEAFAQYVAFLEQELDLLAEKAGQRELAGMAEYFELTTKYEIAFWEMAAAGETWPGI